MNPKKKLILDSALSCFIRKGYHASSIQEIAEEAGIAKGLVYFYFKSKEDLLHSCLKYHFERITIEVKRHLDTDNLSPRERLSGMLRYMFTNSAEHSDLIKILMREQAIHVNDELAAFFVQMRMNSLHTFSDLIIGIYGEDSRTYAIDAASILQAMCNEYTFYLLFNNNFSEADRLVAYIVDRLDDIVGGMIARGAKPLIDYSSIGSSHDEMVRYFEGEKNGWVKPIVDFKVQLDKIKINDTQREELISSIQIMEAEFESETPNKIVIKGMLAYIRSLDLKQLQEPADRLETILNQLN
ncbi:TetR/AcrR family transcriptional regulator [Paenibacillus tarimensis]|uniref:TetR/AcrR family transcriptional regulator n=1 Tax=Paenibacillus tarimensis TaxID=416012 RepID=UPI001F1FF6B1|nr:TetR/AcrR family transcriptional regulator [Paenibacillus tarimensis]MCF2942731.1 TetR/AcrR family transcriptional regulator [Paenibacillus tarimensis]